LTGPYVFDGYRYRKHFGVRPDNLTPICFEKVNIEEYEIKAQRLRINLFTIGILFTILMITPNLLCLRFELSNHPSYQAAPLIELQNHSAWHRLTDKSHLRDLCLHLTGRLAPKEQVDRMKWKTTVFHDRLCSLYFVFRLVG